MSNIVNHRVNKLTNRQTGNVNQLSIDDRNLTEYVPSNCKGYMGQVSIKCKHIKGYDMYSKCKVATALRWRMYRNCKGTVQPQCKQWYIIDVNNGEYQCKVKSSHLISKCKELREKGAHISVKEM